MTRRLLAASTLALVATLALLFPALAQRDVAPRFEVDAAWPRPLPHGWRMGQAAGVAVDRHDHVWVVQRPGGAPTPPVLEFDADGKLLQAWGGPGDGYTWPSNEHGIFVDHQDHVWLAGNGAKDGQILKFTRQGKHLLTIGSPGVVGNDADTRHLNRPASVVVDPQTSELFVADGYGNHRVIVFDAQTGAYKRHWGANGRPPGDPSVKSFATPVHCVRLARDGLLYVCDRRNNRIQVFRKDGTYVTEFSVAPATGGGGSAWDVDLSPDARQAFLYDADGENDHVWTLLRETGKTLAHFGRRGGGAGQFHMIHNMAVDSKGNVYTTEISGKRAQKLVYKGTFPIE